MTTPVILIYVSETQFRTSVANAVSALASGSTIPVNSISLDKLVQIPDKKLLGNRSGATGNVTAVDDVGKWGA